MIDGAFRWFYRLAFRCALVYWRLRRPYKRGGHVALWHGDRLLLVTQSYRTTLSFPGGAARRNEIPRDAALRELTEEVGITLPASALTFFGDTEIPFEFRLNHETVFETRVDDAPSITVDGREIVAASFLTVAEARRQALSPIARWYLWYLDRIGAAAGATETETPAMITSADRP